MSKTLDEILAYAVDNDGVVYEAQHAPFHEAQKRQIKDLMLELIGEDEYPAGGLRPQARNKFKAELREKVNEL